MIYGIFRKKRPCIDFFLILDRGKSLDFFLH